MDYIDFNLEQIAAFHSACDLGEISLERLENGVKAKELELKLEQEEKQSQLKQRIGESAAVLQELFQEVQADKPHTAAKAYLPHLTEAKQNFAKDAENLSETLMKLNSHLEDLKNQNKTLQKQLAQARFSHKHAYLLSLAEEGREFICKKVALWN